MNYICLLNHQTIALKEIPVLNYSSFFETITTLMVGQPARHCVSYFGFQEKNSIRLICCIADDDSHQILVSSCLVSQNDKLPAITCVLLGFEKFEREIHENFGIDFPDHPWLKPVRYAFNRYDKSKTIHNYPFFKMKGEELHEVAVGPIHAGVIEPGHFRFICNGEQILHLEIQLGYQHRGLEQLFLKKQDPLYLAILSENIAGDTAVGHATAFSMLYESICHIHVGDNIHFSRTLALELERIAIHTGDLSAICADIGYQLGNAVYGRLRTPIVNFMQEWAGNRLSKGFVRPGQNPFPFTETLRQRLLVILEIFEKDFVEMSDEFFKLPSVLSRLERTGAVISSEMLEIGAVGMAARAAGINRDIRKSHPFGTYSSLNHSPLISHSADVLARVWLRRAEVAQSISYIRNMLNAIPDQPAESITLQPPKPELFAISLVEGWRGEICHCAITDNMGRLTHYKIKDPSFHNWLALALAVRNNEISDFPVCNKSFNLSYSGHDL